MITAADLKSQNTRELSDNLIRKAWVLQAPQHLAEAYAKIPQETRFALYQGIDSDVRTKWVELMRDYKESLFKKGVKLVLDPVTGVETFPSEYLIDTEELLITAAQTVVDECVSAFEQTKA